MHLSPSGDYKRPEREKGKLTQYRGNNDIYDLALSGAASPPTVG